MTTTAKKKVKLQVPAELRELRQWTYSKSTEELKRPTHTKYEHNGALDIYEALVNAGNDRFIGFYPTVDDPYILIDVDDVSNVKDPWQEMPPKLAQLLQSVRTYSEVSPSGKGLRFILKLRDVEEKKLVESKYALTSELDSPAKSKKVQCNFQHPWQTITQNVTKFSTSIIAKVDLKDLSKLFKFKYKVTDLKNRESKVNYDISKLPDFKKIRDSLMCIPLDQNPRIVRGYEKLTGGAYQHYDFWVHVLMALHDYATRSGFETECYALADEWSQTDPESYEGDAEIKRHWDSFSEKESGITYASIFGLERISRIKWALTLRRNEAEVLMDRPAKPQPAHFKNFRILMEFYNIKIYRDSANSNIIYFSGDKDIIDMYFAEGNAKWNFGKFFGPFDTKSIYLPIYTLMQSEGFSTISHQVAKAHIKTYMMGQTQVVDLFKMYFELPFDELPEELQENSDSYSSSTFEKLWGCLTLDLLTNTPSMRERERDLYKTMFKKWWFGFIRNLYENKSFMDNNSILLLTGEQQIRKTSFFRFILPTVFRNQIAFTTHGFESANDIRDLTKISSYNRVIVWDEIEQYLKPGVESTFKKVIDGLPQTFVDKYEVSPSTFIPIAIYGGTSNLRSFNINRDGNRRIFHIPVSWIDTDTLLDLCWYPIFIELRAEYDELLESGVKMPQLLTPDELSLQEELLSHIVKKQDIDYILESLFDFDSPFPYKEGTLYALVGGKRKKITNFQTDEHECLMTLGQISSIIQGQHSFAVVKVDQLEAALKYKCSRWTTTSKRSRKCYSPMGTIKKGEMIQNQKKRWVMPPRIKPVTTRNLFD